MAKAQETVLELNLNSLSHNFEYLKSKLKPSTKFLGVVKAFAYGSDAVVVAKHLEKLGVDYFAVAYVNEGIVLRENGVTTPILVLHPQPINFKALIEHCLEPSLYNAKVLNEFIETATKQGQKDYPVHIKFNTGLNRLGFSENDIPFIINKLKSTKCVKAKSVFSHLVASEDLDEKEFTENQIKKFISIAERFADLIGYKPWLHLCNTSGLLNYPNAHFDMVRCGIGLYGFGNSFKEDKNLIPIASLKSVISQIHNIEKGESVGYNRSYRASKSERIATIPIGHADGISRIYGQGKGFVSINGKSAPIAGNVCMDMLMVNITNIECKEGDEVIVFGQENSASNLAESAGTISYEILTAISSRVRRTFTK
ncbi:alanine racemase [Winogradskyella alexanderae]|uniref:Alanine racemase n=1 Tax=Winogradskyella alexanderae TaxID=2877123 RepID=A0ABS7XQ99_9FLAO|nr:alanine racemase [Winogradskyella alexanderae]MCA0131211.1 alanine racemase [Winogradskyella alexanderae]